MASRETADCPHCGAEFPASRLACPECGSDTETGWSEDGLTGYSHGLPDEFTDADYDRILHEIDAAPRRPAAATVVRTAVILLLVGALAYALIFG